VAPDAGVQFWIMRPSRRLRIGTTGRRIVIAFSAVLGLFAVALVVILVSLNRIANAETEVARLDHAKHAGHQAAALAREQYIHQAHTMLEWNRSHLGHYDGVVVQARAATDALRHAVDRIEERRQADEIASLVAESDHRFRSEVLPAIANDDHSRVGELHRETEEVVGKVVRINERLNAVLEARSEEAQRRAERIRSQARFLVLSCFGLAILLAGAVGVYLMRSISQPIAALRSGVQRAGSGNLRDEIEIGGDDEFAELARAFNDMTRDLSRHHAQLLESHRLASIGQVASGVAHEVNNPLGVILGYAVLLRNDPALRGREELAIIEDEVRQCQRIVAGLLDLARPVRLELADVDLGDVVREAVARLDESGQTGETSIALEEPPRPVRVRGDEARLKQVLLNLLLNAVEAARDERAADKVVRVLWRSDGDRVAVEVLDRGTGIARDALPRLFEPFFSTGAKGHGLGLAIARSLARAHDGDVTVAPRGDGPGTRAALVLPLRPDRERHS
jgi:two-component system, NtrC family, sensor kinase